jgi:hypothetical protein
MYCFMIIYGKLFGSSRVTALTNRGHGGGRRPGRDVHLRICPRHDVLDKDSSNTVNGLPLRFWFFIREEAGRGENRHIGPGSRTLKRSEVRRSLTYFFLKLLSWLTQGLYKTIVIRSAGNDVLDRADKLANQF